MRTKLTATLAFLLLTFLASAGLVYAHRGSGGGGDDRVRIEVRGAEEEEAEALPEVEIEGNTFEITGEVIKVEGFVQTDGSLLAREIKTNGLEIEEDEAVVTGTTLSSLLSQIMAFLQSLM